MECFEVKCFNFLTLETRLSHHFSLKQAEQKEKWKAFYHLCTVLITFLLQQQRL